MHITILMSTYNGERYLGQQLDSLLSQTVQDFILYINDDCSTDGTFAAASAYAEKYPQKIFVSRSECNSGSAKNNFLRMMTNRRDDYVMLCDQDDVWLPDKIEKTLARMSEAEREFGKETPVLVHTDLTVVNEKLEIISPSLREAMNSDFQKTSLNSKLIQNTLTGCTAMYNRALAELLDAMPDYCLMHDWWLMLVAAAFGKIAPLEEQTILYRQHSDNEVGAKDVRKLKYKIHKILHNGEMKIAIAQTYTQAESFLKAYAPRLGSEQKRLVEIYCSIPQKNKFGKWETVIKYKFMKTGVARKIAQLIYI